MPLVYLLILNYKGCDDTLACIESLKRISYSNVKILVMDNASGDQSVQRIHEKYPDIEVMEMERNLGFAAANNRGIEKAMQEKADYIVLLNNDMEVEPDFLTIMVEAMEKDSSLAATGPAICSFGEDTIQSTGTMINMKTSVTFGIHEGEDYKTIEAAPITCDYVCGACLMIRASIVHEIGLLPECYFLFFEEAEWCKRIKDRKYQIQCLPSARVWHKESASIGSCSPQKMYYLDRNRVLFEKRNATAGQYFYFTIYNTLKVLYRSICKPKTTAGMEAVRDGRKGRISPRYPDTYIR